MSKAYDEIMAKRRKAKGLPPKKTKVKLTAKEREKILLDKEKMALKKRGGRKAPTKVTPVSKKKADKKGKKKEDLVKKARKTPRNYIKK